MTPAEEIKSKLDIVDILREYIALRPAGINFRAPCPFHREKTPSFMVSPEKQIWHCFGCGRGGDIFSFVMEMEGLSFVEALRFFAPRAGVQLRQVDPKTASKRNRLLDLMNLAVGYYHQALTQSKQAEGAREYLEKRGLNEDTITAWRLGYSPDSWDDLLIYLKGKGYREEEIFAAGLSVRKDNTSRYFNRFRGRIMFPINDVGGNPVAFSARVSPEKEAEEKMGKYINSPQTMLYDKSKILFGLDKAKFSIKQKDEAIVMEGQMDVITAHQHDFTNVVASSGTALTSEQIKLLKRYTSNIILSFDQDSAGEAAAERGIWVMAGEDISAKIIELPKGKDPDEYIRENFRAWQEAVSKAKPMMAYFFDKIISELDMEKSEDQRRAVEKLLPLIARFDNKVEINFWLKKLSQRLDMAERELKEMMEKIPYSPSSSAADSPKEIAEPRRLNRGEILSETILSLIFKFPVLINYLEKNLQTDQIFGQFNKVVYRNIVMYYNNNKGENAVQYSEQDQFSYQQFIAWLKDNYGEEVNNQQRLIDRLVFLGDRDFCDYDYEQGKKEAIKLAVQLKKYYLAERLREIEKLISQTEKEKDEARLTDLMGELKILLDEINQLKD